MIGSHATFGDGRRRRRRQAYGRLFRFFLGIAAVAVIGGYAYQVGISASEASTSKLEADLERLQKANLELRGRIAASGQRSSRAEAALDELRRRYAAEVPQGRIALLVRQVREQLEAGVEPERLALLIEAAGQASACSGQPVTKRFMPRTPQSQGPISFIRFDDRVTITGTGEPARNDEGLPEAWYDPAQPVRVSFQTLDGAILSIDGVVPMSHRMAIDGREYRFSIVAGDPSFVEITAQACELPQAAAAEGASATATPTAID
ncbi:MAG: hypothetical protein ACREH6_05085 [Geminicoccaceae bacterium]